MGPSLVSKVRVSFGGEARTTLPSLSYFQGSFAPAYDRLSGLLDRTSAAFPIIDGKVRMQIEVTLDTMPGLAAALPLPTSDAVPQGGGR